MASEVEWLVQIADKPGVLQTRLQHGAEHMAYHQPSRESGRLVFSGPTLQSQPAAGSPMRVTGSVLVFRLPANAGGGGSGGGGGMGDAGEREVREILENDPLAKAGVWDLQAATVTPFKLFRPQ